IGETPVTWTERRLLVQSLRYAEAQEKSLRARLAQAQTALLALISAAAVIAVIRKKLRSGKPLTRSSSSMK
ncbi:MAG: hypothetical protein KA764_05490, partial [Anaerolineales bacterium]|nr:hypothetical protein [Anaerolineales bacterium]